MFQALCKIDGEYKNLDMKDDILSGRYSEDAISDIRCNCCGASAYIDHSTTRAWHFCASHEPWCIYVHDGRTHAPHKITDQLVIDDINEILKFKASAPATTPRGGPTPPGPPKKPIITPEVDDIDTIIQYGVRMIHTVGGIYSHVREKGLDADLGGGLTGRDLFLTSRVLREVRHTGFTGPRIGITKRIRSDELKHPFNVPWGYICLADAFAVEQENSIFFLVKMCREDQNYEFRKKITSKTYDSGRDPHDNVLVLGNWHEYPNDLYNLYISDPINSHCIKFVNYKELC